MIKCYIILIKNVFQFYKNKKLNCIIIIIINNQPTITPFYIYTLAYLK